MKIYLAAYPRGIHRIHETLEPQNLDLDSVVFRSPVNAELKLDRHDPYFEFEFSLSARVVLQCDRCAADFALDLNIVRPMLYVLGQRPSLRDSDDSELGIIPQGATELDLSSDIRDFLILAIPEKILCREECRGLCTQCGTNLNSELCSCQVSSIQIV